ncbi:MAG: hypothetical protein MZV70_70555 [Desulfobacterales bacterium]|nr:hypothetical protein [Desulfobacterales bacterium]
MKNTLRFGQGPALVGAAVLILSTQLLLAQAAAKKAEVVDMGAFKVSVPPGGGWKTDADPESGEVSFSKVKGKGILTALITQGKGVVRVTAVTVIPELLEPHRWRMTEEEAADACVDTYVSESGPDQRDSESCWTGARRTSTAKALLREVAGSGGESGPVCVF